MSNYPCGMRSSYETTVDFRCEDCGMTFDAPAMWDLGMVDLINEGDSQCPNCSSWNTVAL